MNTTLQIPATKTTALAACRVALTNRMYRAVSLVAKDGSELYVEHAHVVDGKVRITVITGPGVDLDGNPTDTSTYTVEADRPVRVTVTQNHSCDEHHFGRKVTARRMERARADILSELAIMNRD